MGVKSVIKNLKLKAAVAALGLTTLMSSAPASALSFVLTDVGGVTGTAAQAGFQAAANFWSSIITNDVTVRINVRYADLGPNVLGSAGSTLTIRSIEETSARIAFFGSNSATDQTVLASGLPNLTPGLGGFGAVDVVTPGYVDALNQLGIDTSTSVFDNDGSFNNIAVALSTANAKALGFGIPDTVSDANISFSSTFGFDFDPTNGIAPGQYDFIGVAIHEFGHALGFLSGADDYDFLGCPSGPGCAAFSDYAVNDDYWGYALDLFRYNEKGMLDWRPGVDSFFSIDGGATSMGGFSSGTFNGDGNQASHWNAPDAAPFCSGFIGIMNPYLCGGREGFNRNAIITSRDIAAFDAIGWNFISTATNPNFERSTASLAVPEPAAWAMMIGGFFLVGSAMRRRTQMVVRKDRMAPAIV
jgi:hypothetical protein